jgi:hypothetical protein
MKQARLPRGRRQDVPCPRTRHHAPAPSSAATPTPARTGVARLLPLPASAGGSARRIARDGVDEGSALATGVGDLVGVGDEELVADAR